MKNKRIYLLCGLTDYEQTETIGVFDDEQIANDVCAEMTKLAREYHARLSGAEDDASSGNFTALDAMEWRFQFPDHERYEVFSYPLNDWDVRAARRKRRKAVTG